MKCPGCGREVTGVDAANRPVSEDFKGAIQDRLRTGGACPICGRTKEASAPMMTNYRTKVILGGLLVVTLVRFAAQYYQSPLRTVPVKEAIRRAVADPRVRGELGEPIHQGRTVRHRMYHDETGWSEAKLTIPLVGSRRKGTLKMGRGRGSATGSSRRWRCASRTRRHPSICWAGNSNWRRRRTIRAFTRRSRSRPN